MHTETVLESNDIETPVAARAGDTLGYARVSTNDQNLDAQRARLIEAGAIRVFTDIVSGKRFERPGLAELIDHARPGDRLCVIRLDRLGRSLKELLETVDGLKAHGIHLVSLEERLDTSSAAGELVFHVFGSIAHFERRLISERTRDGTGDVDGRFIPARAGNTGQPPVSPNSNPVHPRAGGEHPSGQLADSSQNGSSPRGRGTQRGIRIRQSLGRFIPARAGDTVSHSGHRCGGTVHPRAGGEHAMNLRSRCGSSGSSPRWRGTPAFAICASMLLRFIPARAGNTRSEWPATSISAVHPRAGGEHGLPSGPRILSAGSSPRGRGTHGAIRLNVDIARFIPARAGNTPRSTGARPGPPVHPRAGGEHIRSP